MHVGSDACGEVDFDVDVDVSGDVDGCLAAIVDVDPHVDADVCRGVYLCGSADMQSCRQIDTCKRKLMWSCCGRKCRVTNLASVTFNLSNNMFLEFSKVASQQSPRKGCLSVRALSVDRRSL